MEWKLTKKSVNSEPLFKDISQMVNEGLEDLGIIWNSETHRESFVDFIDEWLMEKAQEMKIDQWNVVCDFRNNKVADMEDGKYTVDIYYRQRNCLNTTHLHYELWELDELELDFFLDED